MGSTNFPSIPDPGNSASSQQATLLALTAAVRVLQATVGQLTGDGITGNSVLKNLHTALGHASASIKIEQKVRADAGSALAELIVQLRAQFNDNIATVTDTLKAYADATSALAQHTLELEAQVNYNEIHATAKLTEEQTARVDGDVALASDIEDLTATSGDNTAAIHAESVARADADSAMATEIDTLTATVGDNTAAITSEATVRANADTAIASSVTSLSATVDGHTSSISTNATAIADINGHLSASYGVTLDVNGYATGFNLLSTGVGTGSFNIRADIMTMVIPGYSPKPVMVINTINGVPTLTFNGHIIGDGTTQNNAYASGSLGSSGVVAGGAHDLSSGDLTITAHGRRAVLLFCETSAGRSLAAATTINVLANGVVFYTYTPSVTPNPGGSDYFYYSTTHMFSHLPSAGSVTYRADVIGATTDLFFDMTVVLSVIELGA